MGSNKPKWDEHFLLFSDIGLVSLSLIVHFVTFAINVIPPLESYIGISENDSINVFFVANVVKTLCRSSAAPRLKFRHRSRGPEGEQIQNTSKNLSLARRYVLSLPSLSEQPAIRRRFMHP